MVSSHKMFWTALLLCVMTSHVVQTAPTGVQEQLQAKPDELESGEFQEKVEEAEKLEDIDEGHEGALIEDDAVDKIDVLPAADDQATVLKEDEQEEREEDVLDEGTDDVAGDFKGDVVEKFRDDVVSDDTLANGDDAITKSSSEPDASDYPWEPSLDYGSLAGSDLEPWFTYDLPYEPSQWSSMFYEDYFPYYGSSYDNVNDNRLGLDVTEGAFDGIPGEELNNKVDQTVDEFLCMLGLCGDDKVSLGDKGWEGLNEIQFTEEGMMDGDEKEDESQEKDIYAVDIQAEGSNDGATNSSADETDGGEASSPPESGRHRSKRDLSWDELDRDTALLGKINSPGVLEGGRTDQVDQGLTAEERFEDLLQYFKEEAALSEGENTRKEFYMGVPEPLLDDIVGEAAVREITEEEEEEGEREGLEEAGQFINDGIEAFGESEEEEEEGEEEDDWGAYLVPGSPYREDVLKYDGYKRDDEREALKVYVESLQNLEGYRKRAAQGDYLDVDPRSAANFLRQLEPRSPPNAIRYPKTGLEPFSREKYFPLAPNPDDGTSTDPDPVDTLEKYNELLDLLNTELEAAVLISTIKDMAAELGRDRRLLDELEEEETEEELQLALDENNREILEVVGAENSLQAKRVPRVIDYPDFNEYPPEFHRSFSAPSNDADSLSEEELLELYNQYLNEAQEEAKWGDFVSPPRDRREGEDSLPGPHMGYYVQGRMMGDLIKPKRDWGAANDDLPEGLGEANPYILLEPSDLGYDEWPGDFDIFYDNRDGTFVLYPYPKPQDASVLSEEALLDALGLSGRDVVLDGNEMEGEEVDGVWGDFIDDTEVLQDDLKEIDDTLAKLEDLRLLTEIAEEVKAEESQEEEEENLLRELLQK